MKGLNNVIVFVDLCLLKIYKKLVLHRTCHLLIMEKDLQLQVSKASNEEIDMIDLAFNLTNASCLGC
jgi:hypothetical protein